MSQLTELRGRFTRLAWSKKGEGRRFCIASVQLDSSESESGEAETISVKGDIDPNDLIQDLEYRFYGKWDKPNEYGRQFSFRQFKRGEPHSRVAVIGYLKQFAIGIGPVYASQLWDAFGADAVRVLRTDPTRVSNVLGIPAGKARAASDALKGSVDNEDLRLELVQLFEGRYFPRKLIDIVIAQWGLSAPDRIRRDPFTLMVHKFPGCGFARCDQLYVDLGLPLDRLKRQFFCIWRALRDNGDGHTWHPLAVAEAAVRQGISGLVVVALDWRRAVRLGVRAGWLRVRKDDQGQWWVAEARKADNEASVASDMRRLMNGSKRESLSGLYWSKSKDGDDTGYEMYRRHYAAKKNPNPKIRQFVGPGEKLVLIGVDGNAVLAWRKFIDDCIDKRTGERQQGVNCAVFRNESSNLSSDMILEAMQFAWDRWPKERLYTYVDPTEVKSRNPGYCFQMAGWTRCGETKKGLIVFEVLPHSASSLWPDPNDIEGLTSHQREQLKLAFSGRVAILTGDPGTGKTTAASLVLRHLRKTVGAGHIYVCTPTNLAAMRLTSVLASHGVTDIPVQTFHRTLCPHRDGHDGSGWGFFFNRENKLPCKVIFIDEDSMRDIDISASLFSAISDGTLVLFLGDTNQLPPVGHGAPLRDGIAAGIPRGHFSKIERNSGSITEFCQSARAGRRPTPPGFIALDIGRNWKHIECSSPEMQKQVLASLLESMGRFQINGRLINPITDSQILVALNEKGDLARTILNQTAQAILNPLGSQADGNPFRQGDKVICGENCNLKVYIDDDEFTAKDDDAPEEFVANGEIGIVKHVERRFSVVELPGGRVVRVPVTRGDDESSGSFDLAYAITIHKSQGSQWPVVFMLTDRAANRLGSRELWNTGGSRPTKLLVTIGELSTIERQCQRVALKDRKTFLAEMIRDGEQRKKAHR